MLFKRSVCFFGGSARDEGALQEIVSRSTGGARWKIDVRDKGAYSARCVFIRRIPYSLAVLVGGVQRVITMPYVLI